MQQELMRHSDIRATMNIYGDVVTDEMEQAHGEDRRFGSASGLTDRKRIAGSRKLLVEWLLR